MLSICKNLAMQLPRGAVQDGELAVHRWWDTDIIQCGRSGLSLRVRLLAAHESLTS